MRGKGKRKRITDDGWSERGGYMHAKVQKLAEQNTADVLDSYIFQGVTIYINGYTKPTSEELKAMVTENGGVFSHYYSKTKVTHIIASNLPTSKIIHLKNEKVVSPQWIVDSMQAKMLLPYQKYMLYDPQNLQQCNIATALKALCRVSASNIDSEDDFEDETNEASRPKRSETAPPASNVRGDHQNFVADFYDRSRLHHISMWGAESKAYVASLQKQKSEEKSACLFKGMEKLSEEIRILRGPSGFCLHSGKKVYAHIDIDCFFVSVGLLKKPELVGRPVAVTHFKGRNPRSNSSSKSDIASCSYEARKSGVRNGMFFGEAQKVCPELIAIPYDFEAYKTTSCKFYDVVLSYTLDVEAVSCDELFVDCSDLLRQTGSSPLQLAAAIRRDVFAATGCNSSCGMGGNMLVARLSTKLAKPNGQHYVEQSTEIEFMKKMKVSDLPGVGYATSKKLSSMNVETCEELGRLSLSELQKHFGAKVGAKLFKQARGEDDRILKLDVERKSVSAEINYGIRFTQKTEAEEFVKTLSKEVQSRLQQLTKKGRQLTLKIKVRQEGAPVETYKFLGHGICDNLSKSCLLPMATDDATIIGRECCNLLSQLNIPVEDLRGVGIQVTMLEGMQGAPTTTCNNILKYATVRSKPSDRNCSAVLNGENKIADSISIKTSDVQTKKSPDSDSFLSLSQVDMDTLSELPEDIQEEIRDAMKRKSLKQQNFVAGLQGNNPTGDLNPSCSHWSDKNLNRPAGDPVGSNEPEQRVADHANPRLDESFLRAMPEDIRQELLNTYKPGVSNDKNSLQPKNALPLKQVPSKKRRGRKKTVVPKNVQKKGTAQTLNSIVTVNKVEERNTKFERVLDLANDATKEEEEEAEINLFGCVDANDIKRLVRKWTTCRPVPDEFQVSSLVEFLLRLVQSGDIERAFVVLRSLRRIEDVSVQWKEEIMNVVETSQAAVESIYGGKLKLNVL